MEPRPTTARANRAGGWNPGAIVGWLVGLGPLVFRPGLVAPSIGPQTVWFCCALAGAAVLTTWRFPYKEQPTNRAWLTVYGLTLALIALAAFRAGTPTLALKTVYYRLIFLGFILVGLRIAADRTAWSAVAAWLISGAALISLIGLGQAVGWLEFIPQAAPPAATLGNKNAAAHLVAAALPLALARLAGANTRPWMRPMTTAGCLVMVAFLAEAGSWTGAGAALIGALTCGALARSPRIRRLARTGLVVCLAGGFALAAWSQVDRLDSAPGPLAGKTEARRTVWVDSLVLIKARPILGAGLGQFPTLWPLPETGPEKSRVNPALDLAAQFQRVHNDYLEWSLEAGWPSGLLLAVLAGWPLVRLRGRAGDDQGAGLAGSLTVWVVIACFSFPLELPASAAWWGLALGAGLGLGPAKPGPAASPSLKTTSAFQRGLIVAAGLLIICSLGPPGRQMKAESLTTAGWAGQDESLLVRAVKANRWGMEPPFRLGLFYQQRGRYDRAAEVYAELLRTYPNQAGVLFNLALCRLNNGQADRAIGPAVRLLQLAPDDRRVLLLNWRVGLKTGRGEAAVSAARRLVELWPRDKENILALAQAQAAAGKDRAALDSLADLLGGSGKIRTRRLGQTAVLLAELNRRVADRPDLAEKAEELGRLLRLRGR